MPTNTLLKKQSREPQGHCTQLGVGVRVWRVWGVRKMRGSSHTLPQRPKVNTNVGWVVPGVYTYVSYFFLEG